MAASDHEAFEHILTSNVDESAISALVGSLESQLASPTIKDSSEQNSSHSGLTNHVEDSRVAHTSKAKAGLQNDIEINANAPNGSNSHLPESQTVNSNSVAASTITQSSVSPGEQVLPIGINSTLNSLTVANVNNNSQPIVKFTPASNTSVNSVLGTQPVSNQVLVTVGSTNTGTVVAPATQTGGVTVSLNSNLSEVSLPNHNAVTISAGQTGSNVGTVSAIHSLANVAAAQAPISIPNTSLALTNSVPRLATVQQTVSSTVTINTNNVPRPKVVMQGKPAGIRMVAAQSTPQTVIPVSVPVSTVKLPNANPANSNVITLANKSANAQTVTVVRPGVTTQPQLHIGNRLPGAVVAGQTKVLAPRTITTPVRIAPQQVTTRPQLNTVRERELERGFKIKVTCASRRPSITDGQFAANGVGSVLTE